MNMRRSDKYNDKWNMNKNDIYILMNMRQSDTADKAAGASMVT